MGLNPRGRGRGGKGPFPGKGRRGGGGIGGQGPPPFRGGPPGMYGPPPMGFPPGPPFGAPPYFGGPSGSNFGPRRPPGFGKFPRKNFKGKQHQQKSNDTPVPEIDLTKPWVTEQIKAEDAKKIELLEIWRKSKDDADWKNYKQQKQQVQTLYDQAKQEYITSHPEEAFYWMQRTPSKNYYCETCDKSFREEDELLYHESEHETCGEEGCEFTAHPKIIAKHIKMQHETGLYSRIGKLYSHEDINKWIEERKRRYPSRKVIEEKKALEQKKVERGERINRNESRFNKSFGKNGQNENKSSFNKRVEKQSSDKKIERVKKKPIVILQPTDENIDWRGSIPPFPGIRKCEPESESKVESKPEVIEEELEPDTQNFSDDEWESANTTIEVLTPTVNSSLSLLASCYGSDEEEEEEKEMKGGASRTVNDNLEKIDKTNEVLSDGNDSAPEEVKTVSSKDVEENKELSHEKKISGKRKRRHNRAFKNKLENKPVHRNNKKLRSDNKDEMKFDNVRQKSLTLLEKLLSNEIRHERNVILQCVRYVVQNNFFQK